MKSQILLEMKTILLLVSLVFSGMALSSCTNDEGDDLEVLTPEETEEQLALTKDNQKA